jgi:hypothetical protein
VKLMQLRGEAMVLGAAACGAISWRAAALALVILIAGGGLRLFTEWQRRKAFTMLLKGTVILQQDSPGGQAMTVTWGGPAKDVARPPGDHR